MGEAWLRPGLLDRDESFDGFELSVRASAHHEAVDVDVATLSCGVESDFGCEHVVDGFTCPEVADFPCSFLVFQIVGFRSTTEFVARAE